MDQQRSGELSALARRLGYAFNDPGLLDAALCHSSYVHEHPGQELEPNERLEFLGDAVLELSVSGLLFARFPGSREGELSKARAAMVNETSLARLAGELDLGPLLLLGKGEELQEGREKPSILADAMEAVLAAVYLDGGLEAARPVVEALLAEMADEAIKQATRKDYKTRVQELVQEKLRTTPRYQILETSGPDHDKTFKVEIVIQGESLAHGSGKSKKEAQQEAARQALKKIEKQGISD